ncbi:hypothetical protein RvY_10527-2 [Ramazzottius varieornatus]|uniref:Uncharacterized protein n=1 Tax=Ramazzottius varieornatus TaxID=947166 RepID=A0A1D1VM21_RAMVA|nr:hypothetical protein RvY_10527-2 [Ramazzottius varieornatus]
MFRILCSFCRVSSYWKYELASPTLNKGLHMDISEMGNNTNFPTGQLTSRYEGPPVRVFDLLDQFGYCFMGERVQIERPHWSSRREQPSFNGLMRFVKPATRVLHVSFSPSQFPPVDLTDPTSVHICEFYLPKFVRVITHALANSPSVTYLGLENFWVEGGDPTCLPSSSSCPREFKQSI